MKISKKEVDDLIVRHSPTLRRELVKYIRENIRFGETFFKRDIAIGFMRKHGYDIRRVAWWREQEFLLENGFVKEGRKWRRVY